MTLIRLAGGAAVAAMLATSAFAQSAPSPEKILLARQLVEASGGADQLRTVLQTVFTGMSSSLYANLAPEQKRLAEVLLQKMQDRFLAAAPQLMDGTVQIYAQNLTEKELRDALAWQQSDSGQSLKRKLPLITAESIRTWGPVLTQVMAGLKQDVVDEACKQAGCTEQDRQALVTAMNKAIQKQPG